MQYFLTIVILQLQYDYRTPEILINLKSEQVIAQLSNVWFILTSKFQTFAWILGTIWKPNILELKCQVFYILSSSDPKHLNIQISNML